MPSNTWYVTLDGSEHGPLSPTEVKHLVNQGRIVAETAIRRDGMSATVPAGQVKGLLPPGSATAPPHRTPDGPAPEEATPRPEPRLISEPDEDAEDEEDPVALRAGPLRRVGGTVIDIVAVTTITVALMIAGFSTSAGMVSATTVRVIGEWNERLGDLVDDEIAFDYLMQELGVISHNAPAAGVDENAGPGASRRDTRMVPIEMTSVVNILLSEELGGEIDAEKLLSAVLNPFETDGFLGGDASDPLDRLISVIENVKTGVSPDDPELEVLMLVKYAEVLSEAEDGRPVSRETAALSIDRWSQVDQWRNYYTQNLTIRRSQLATTWGPFLRKAYDSDKEKVPQELTSAFWSGTALIILAWLFAVTYIPLFEWLAGGTLGKLAVGVRVVDAERHPIRLWRTLWRHLLRIIPLYFITAFMSERTGLHERFSHTQVVYRDAVVVRRPRGSSRSRGGQSRTRGRAVGRGTTTRVRRRA